MVHDRLRGELREGPAAYHRRLRPRVQRELHHQPLSGLSVVVDGSAHEILIGGNHVFDGAGGATALGLSAVGGNFILGTYYNYTGTLTDTVSALANSIGSAPPVVYQTTAAAAPEAASASTTYSIRARRNGSASRTAHCRS